MLQKLFHLTKLGGFVLLDILQTIVLALAIFMICYLFLFQPHQVKGHSMDLNFEDGEYLITDKVTYRFHNPERGDVIVFNAPPNRREDYIKRIIALPGESVTVRGGKTYINSKGLDEKYLSQDVRTNAGVFLTEGSAYSVGPEEYVVMGDNREHSSDSRSWGPIKKKDIIGRAWFVYWPLNVAGKIPKVVY